MHANGAHSSELAWRLAVEYAAKLGSMVKQPLEDGLGPCGHAVAFQNHWDHAAVEPTDVIAMVLTMSSALLRFPTMSSAFLRFFSDKVPANSLVHMCGMDADVYPDPLTARGTSAECSGWTLPGAGSPSESDPG